MHPKVFQLQTRKISIFKEYFNPLTILTSMRLFLIKSTPQASESLPGMKIQRKHKQKEFLAIKCHEKPFK